MDKAVRDKIIADGDEIIEKWERYHALKRRFEVVFGEDDDDAARRVAREIEIDGDLTAIPAQHRLAVTRQLLLALWQHDILDMQVDSIETHWRVIAQRLGLPYLEVHAAVSLYLCPEFTRADLEDWLGWMAEHAPERFAETVERARKAVAR